MIAFFILKDDILGTLKRTGFFTHLLGSEPAFVEKFQLEDEKSNSQPTDSPSPVIIQDNSGLAGEPVVEFQDLSTIDLATLQAQDSSVVAPVTSPNELELLLSKVPL